MNVKLTPEQRKFSGILLFFVGIISLAMTGAIIALISTSRVNASERFGISQNECKAKLGPLGGQIEDIPGRIIWKKDDINQAPARLGEASVASVLCPGWKLRNACIGSQCPDNNSIRIVMEPIFPKPN